VAIRFLDCVIDDLARTLLRHGMPVHLSPKAFELLLLLVMERPRALPKSEILERVWPGTFVTDASLARAIHEVRVGLGEATAAAAIRTVHGHGYAFAGDAIETRAIVPNGPRPVGWVFLASRAIPLSAGDYVLGRDPAADLPLECTLASWHHARLAALSDTVTLLDLGSKNGTFVGGERLTTPRVLQDGDDITIGSVRLVFRSGERLVETESAHHQAG
jgi:DNA-binding winged helix-turn-helix (wHTH) protein